MASTNSVLGGGAPLTRSKMSGGVQLTRKEQFDNRKFGAKSRLMSFGKMHEPIELAFNRYFTVGISQPVINLDKSFTQYFKFVKKARKEDLSHSGRSGFRGMFKEFSDFKLWKKIFGIARDPQIAALHQIRDILIETSGRKKKTLIAKGLALDPEEVWSAAPRILKGFFDKYKAKGNGFFGNLMSATRGVAGEIKESREEQQKIRENLVLGQKKSRKSRKGAAAKVQKMAEKADQKTEALQEQMKGVAEGIKQGNAQRKEQVEDAKFDKYAAGDQKGGGEKGKMSAWAKWLGLAAMATVLFGPKGTIAIAAGAFFMKILPGLMMRGMRGMFSKAATGVAGFAKGLIKKGPRLKARARLARMGGKKVAGKVSGKLASVGKIAGGTAGKVAGAGLGGLLFGIETYQDWKKYGREEFGKGNVGKGIANSMLGADLTDAGAGGIAKSMGKQALKYGGLGAAIGSVVPGLGTAIGAGLGVAAGAIGTGIKALWEKGWLQYFGRMIKKNWLGAGIGGLVGSMLGPVGTALGMAGGSWLQDKLRDPKIREKIGETFSVIGGKISGAAMKVGGAVKKAAGKIWGRITEMFQRSKVGTIVGGILGSVVPGYGTFLGMMAGDFLETKVKAIGMSIGNAVKDFAGRLVGKVQGLWGDVTSFFSEPQSFADIASFLKGKAKEIIFGIANTLVDWAKALWTAIKSLGIKIFKKGVEIGASQFTSAESETNEQAKKRREEKERQEKEREKREERNTKANEASAKALKSFINIPWITFTDSKGNTETVLGSNPKANAANSKSKNL